VVPKHQKEDPKRELLKNRRLSTINRRLINQQQQDKEQTANRLQASQRFHLI